MVRQYRQYKSTTNGIWRELLGWLEAILLALFITTFLFTTVGVVGVSMRPNLDGGPGAGSMIQSVLTGDRVFVPKYDTWLRRAGILGNYQRGDIVVLREPERGPMAQYKGRRDFVIKRVIAVPGDTIRIEAGQVILNGQPLDQSFITATGEITPAPINFPVITQEDGQVTGWVMAFRSLPNGLNFPVLAQEGVFMNPVSPTDPRVQTYYALTLSSLAPIPAGAPEGEAFVHDIVIPDGHYFIMGDNRTEGGSEDSRYFGPVPAINIAGKATFVFWPFMRNGEMNMRRLRPPAAF